MQQTLCRWAVMGAERYLSRVYECMKQKLSDYHVMHADETVVEVRRDGRPAGTESRMWVYRSGELEPNPVILYEYQKTRKKEHARELQIAIPNGHLCHIRRPLCDLIGGQPGTH